MPCYMMVLDLEACITFHAYLDIHMFQGFYKLLCMHKYNNGSHYKHISQPIPACWNAHYPSNTELDLCRPLGGAVDLISTLFRDAETAVGLHVKVIL